jgi:microsomal epoxide hydrolase
VNNQKAFEIPYLEKGIELLNKKLDLVTWPDEPQDFGWKYGANLHYMKNLSDYWRNQLDWKSVVERLNKYNHFK